MARQSRSFNDVLAEAVADLMEHGFDSVERIAYWTQELRTAAERSMVSTTTLEQEMRIVLGAVYRREVEKGGLLRHHPNVERFTLQKVKPALRAELDRRIMASADLIRLDRAAAIEKTLQRFQGWSTSIPQGGVSAETRSKVRGDVKKAIGQLPFEERRVLIDQGHKLVAAISDIVAVDGGAIAGRWRSHWRQSGYNYREDHKERDGVIYLMRESWARSAGLVKKGPGGYYDEHEAAAQLPFCRCYVTWLYHLTELPDDMLTAKGKAAATGGGGARTDSADIPAARRGPSGVPVPVDREHDVVWMAVVSRDCDRLYVDQTIPDEVEIARKMVDPAEILWAHESAEWLLMSRLRAVFLGEFLRQPDEAERVVMYEMAHREAGIPAERKRAKELGVDWPAWEAWSRGELARLEHRPILFPPPDPHVRPSPHDRRQPMEDLSVENPSARTGADA